MLVAEAAVVGHALICNGLHHSNSQSASSLQCCVLGKASRVCSASLMIPWQRTASMMVLGQVLISGSSSGLSDRDIS